jgi:diguanylate cyclase (GGDEF)-like protein
MQNLALLKADIEQAKHQISSVISPLASVQARYMASQDALVVSDTALSALTTLHTNSLETIQAGDKVIDFLKQTIGKHDRDQLIKTRSIEKLKDIIEKNRVNLAASASALSAVNELAFNDELTGLPNRRLLNDRLKQMIVSNKRWESYSAAVFLDLDKFKRLNDEFGHEAGDQLLVAVGQRLKASVRETDTVARYGGDEFVLLLDKLQGNLVDARREAEVIAQKVLRALAPPYTLQITEDGERKPLQYQSLASLGVVVFNGDVSEEKNILDWADEAMYWSKSEGGNTVRFYDAVNSTEQTLKKLYELAIDNDIETNAHGLRTRQFVKVLALRCQAMNIYKSELDDQAIERMYKTTQLHDIGKSRIPYEIIHKNGQLSSGEWALMKTHTTLGVQILDEAKKKNSCLVSLLATAMDIAGYHHERWDGSGYPYGLAGTHIPLAGRIMCIADVYDALISQRTYKPAWRHEDACTEILSQSGKQFDPLLIEAFKREQDNFKEIAKAYQDGN